MSEASGMPCTLPLGEESGVFMSVWASIQSRPIFWFLTAIKLGDAGDGTGGNRMISAEDQRNFAGLERFENEVSAFGASRGNFLQVLGVRRAFFFLLRDGDGDVAGVFDDVADGFEAGFESGDADGGWTHVDAAARLAEVERNADHADLAGSDTAVGRGSCHK